MIHFLTIIGSKTRPVLEIAMSSYRTSNVLGFLFETLHVFMAKCSHLMVYGTLERCSLHE